MNISTKLLKAAAGSAGAASLDVDEVFSTHVYDGTNAHDHVINNGIDLSGEGGLVWIKSRDVARNHALYDTERGVNKYISSNTASASTDLSSSSDQGLKAFNSNGFTVDDNELVNANDPGLVSWTFRKQAKFFDIVSYTGNNGTQTINHNLGSVPGMIIVKRLNDAGNWSIYHRSLGATKYVNLNQNFQAYTNSSYWNDTAPTSTQFSVGLTSSVDSAPYIAYLFAHHNSDGEFGPNSDQDVIKCGSFSTDSSGNATVNLGFEPQWLMVKATNQNYNWEIYDQIRGFGVTGHNILIPNSSNAESSNTTAGNTQPTSTGFSIGGGYWGNNVDLIYMAIRKGPLAEPTSSSDVFAISTNGQAGDSKAPAYRSTFPVDMYFEKSTGSSAWYISSRLTGSKYMSTNATSAEATDSNLKYDFMNGVYNSTGSNSAYYGWMWRRAPSYFDVVCYTGNYTDGRTVTHNLGVAPEMIWVKLRDTYSAEWMVFHKDLTTNHNLQLDSDVASADYSGRVRSPTATTFTVGNDTSVNRQSPLQYIAYLFATVAGVSKVGSYTGSGASQTIDCGFSNGAKFVLIKCTSQNSTPWLLFDSVRGLTTNVDPHLRLDSTDAEASQAANDIEPHNSGFIVNSVNNTNNGNGESYIFYAIAI